MLRIEDAVELCNVETEEQNILDWLCTAKQSLSYFEAPLLSDLGRFDDPDQASKHLTIALHALENAARAMKSL